MRPGPIYNVNAGIWAFTDRTNAVGAAAARSLLKGTISYIYVARG
jgi:hypothetical protein